MPSDVTYDYGCLMITFKINQDKWKKFIDKLIKPEDIYDEEGYGVEDENHTTLLYGIHHDKFNLLDATPLLKKLNSVSISSSKIDCFMNDKYDVLKFNLDSKDLHDMNALICKNFEYTTDYPQYQPHSTIAYLRPGTGSQYIRKLSKPYVFTPASYKYSAPTGEKTLFTI